MAFEEKTKGLFNLKQIFHARNTGVSIHMGILSLIQTENVGLATKHNQTLFGDQIFSRKDPLFERVLWCLIVFDKIFKDDK